jgi:hypothetical protein
MIKSVYVMIDMDSELMYSDKESFTPKTLATLFIYGIVMVSPSNKGDT